MLDLNGPLWKLAIKFYGGPGVAKACLQIQDEVGVDTVHLLLLLYADTVLDRALSAATIRSGRLVMEQWRGTTVLPIRNVRRALKPPAPGLPDAETKKLRNEVKRIELGNRSSHGGNEMAEAFG